MARTSRSMLSAPRLLAGTSALLVLLALLPPRAIRWENELSGTLTLLLGPVQGPLKAAVSLVSEAGAPASTETPEQAALREEADEYKMLWLQVQQENERLRRQVAELQKGSMLNPQATRQQYAPIIGPGIDLSPGILKAKAGEREGVIPGSVAAVEGVQLVGKVTKVEARYCLVLPITQRVSGAIRGVVVYEDGERGPLCDLLPTDTGVLRGRVLAAEENAPLQINRLRQAMEKGPLEVRLDDPQWPSSAQMLIVGYVEEITPLPQLPTRPVVTVRPRFKLDALSEVVIRVPMEAASEKTGAGGGTP